MRTSSLFSAHLALSAIGAAVAIYLLNPAFMTLPQIAGGAIALRTI